MNAVRMISRMPELVDRYRTDQARRGVTRRLEVGSYLVLAAVGAADLLILTGAHGRVQVAAFLVLTAIAGWGSSQSLRTRSTYRKGYVDGRLTILSSMLEARRRGFSTAEWVQAEIERGLPH